MGMMIGGPMGGMGGDEAMGMASPETENFILAFFHKLPMWAQGIVLTALVIFGAWILGIFIGKLYASCKYPDPEKQTILNPRLKIGFMAVIAICGFWIYSSFTAPPKDVMEVSNPDGIISDEENPNGEDADSENLDGENTEIDDETENSDVETDEETTEEADTENPTVSPDITTENVTNAKG